MFHVEQADSEQFVSLSSKSWNVPRGTCDKKIPPSPHRADHNVPRGTRSAIAAHSADETFHVEHCHRERLALSLSAQARGNRPAKTAATIAEPVSAASNSTPEFS